MGSLKLRWWSGSLFVLTILALIGLSQGAPRERDSSVEEQPLGRFLADYWGARWPQLRERILAQGADLTVLVDPSEIPPWESVRERIRDEFHVLDEPTLELFRNSATHWGHGGESPADLFGSVSLNPERKALDEDAIASLEALAREFEPQLEALAEASAQAYLVHVNGLWIEGRVDHAPFVPVERERPPGARLYLKRHYDLGVWKVTIAVYRGEDPVLDAVQDEIRRLRDERVAAVRARIRAL